MCRLRWLLKGRLWLTHVDKVLIDSVGVSPLAAVGGGGGGGISSVVAVVAVFVPPVVGAEMSVAKETATGVEI